MTLIIFIIVLAVLIFVHELGHFVAAKATGMRVDKFAIGFPPKLFSKKVGETEYAVNLIPFGGYVSIFGEDGADQPVATSTVELEDQQPSKPMGTYESPEGDTESPSTPLEDSRSFVNKPKWAQAIVLLSGVLGNIVFAWLLISIGFMSGFPVSAGSDSSLPVKDSSLVITSVLPDSPAEEAGLRPGDRINSIRADGAIFSNFDAVSKAQRVIANSGTELIISYERADETGRVEIETQEGILEDRRAIGVTLDMVGTAELPFFRSFYEGAKLTVGLIVTVTIGLATLIADAFRGAAELSQVAGPVGIAGLIGDASRLGFVYLASFTAFISINLAILNLIPFPALDGGRLLFVVIETVSRRRINTQVANWVNVVGFSILILLMIVITFNDIARFF